MCSTSKLPIIDRWRETRPSRGSPGNARTSAILSSAVGLLGLLDADRQLADCRGELAARLPTPRCSLLAAQ